MPLRRIDPSRYDLLLEAKIERFRQQFAPLGLPEPEIFASAPLHYRLRAEFRIWHDGDALDYAMYADGDAKTPVPIDAFPVATERIAEAMPRLRELLRSHATLRRNLFQVEFLATLSGELMITLIYHRALDADWEFAARALAATLGVLLIGRSRKHKIVLDRDWLTESFSLGNRVLRYRQFEGSFSQPNGGINRQMLGWAQAQVAPLGGDLLELYCGNGNFTVALAPSFDRVLATEISKTSTRAAQFNLADNGIDNVTIVRMSSEELSCALARERVFRRLQGIDLDQYRFSTLFVDPPRSGLDPATLQLAAGFRNILYISCNPETLRENVAALAPTHRITAAAGFDQFPYTDHLECGLLLTRRVT